MATKKEKKEELRKQIQISREAFNKIVESVERIENRPKPKA